MFGLAVVCHCLNRWFLQSELMCFVLMFGESSDNEIYRSFARLAPSRVHIKNFFNDTVYNEGRVKRLSVQGGVLPHLQKHLNM